MTRGASPSSQVQSQLTAPRSTTAHQSEIVVFVSGTVEATGKHVLRLDEPHTMRQLVPKLGTLPRGGRGLLATIWRQSPEKHEARIRVDIWKLMASGDPEEDVPIEHGDRILFREHSDVIY
jgi:hypothetical protein